MSMLVASTSRTVSSLQPCCRAAAAVFRRRRLATIVQNGASQSETAAQTPIQSETTSREWKRPVKKGAIPAYDEALALLERDREDKLKQLQQAKAELAGLSSDGNAEVVSRRKTQLQNRIEGLEIAAAINMPETRTKFRNGQSSMSEPVMRYMAEQAWRKDGRLGILVDALCITALFTNSQQYVLLQMQRVTQMHIVPDLLAIIDPDVDMSISVKEGRSVVPGSYLLASQTRQEPVINAQVYHNDERLYTLLMVDPDSPDVAKATFKTVCHWAISDIPLNATSSSISSSTGRVLLPYIAPHPEKGTPYHRYSFLLFRQPAKDAPSSTKMLQQHGDRFSVRDFAKQWNLHPVGVTFFRQVWSREVKDVFEKDLNMPEPVYGKPKKVDRFAQATVGNRAVS
ncbi:mitochondrial 54S ribosomal protein YmL35 [Cystobasidiomycetes sp. EMM_F5]